jgi:hypothetical protein
MADIDNSLLLEHLKQIQERLTRLENGQGVILAEIRAMKGHQASFMASEVAQDATTADLALRVERIERRLDLREEA